VNITHVVENLNRGGLERMVLDLVKLQQQQGHQCQVVCVYETGTLAHELDTIGIPVIACHKGRGIDLRALKRARWAIDRHDTDVLHTHNPVAHYQAVLASCGLDVLRILNTRHGMGAGQRTGRKEWLYRRSLARTDLVVTVCEAARRNGISRGMLPQTMTRVVPNGIDVEGFTPASSEMHVNLQRMLGLPDDAFLIGNVGRLNWTKDQAGLIRAFRQVHEQHPEAALLLIGDGELRADLEQCAVQEQVRHAVHFLGDRNDVRELLQGLNMFVLSSASEGYSMALLEACAVALPIIATDVGGNGEIIQSGRTGQLVPPGEPDALAEAMLLLMNEPHLLTTYGSAARDWVEKHGSLEAMAERYERLYQGTECETCA
jgi:glycosyltransferase involved in cell wall biosynthesis